MLTGRSFSYALAGVAFAVTTPPLASNLLSFSQGTTADVTIRRAAQDTADLGGERMPNLYVASYLPHLGCEGSQAAGAIDATSYKRWIRGFAQRLEGEQPIVILEPGAIGEIDCLAPRARSERYALIVDAVRVLKATGSHVYLDVGGARGTPTEEMAVRLKLAGIEEADGFSLNVAGFLGNTLTIAYGRDLSKRVGGKHFVVDTSRNGRNASPSGDGCSSPGQLAGIKPTTNSGDSLVDAFLWVKTARESNGTCIGFRNGEWR